MSFGISAIVVAGVAAVGANVAANKSRHAQASARKTQEKVRQTQDARSRIAQVREARMSQAQVLQGGASQGALNSSAVQGGYSAIGSNAENNIQFINQVDSFQKSISSDMSRASNYQGQASAYGAVSSIAASFIPAPKAKAKTE